MSFSSSQLPVEVYHYFCLFCYSKSLYLFGIFHNLYETLSFHEFYLLNQIVFPLGCMSALTFFTFSHSQKSGNFSTSWRNSIYEEEILEAGVTQNCNLICNSKHI